MIFLFISVPMYAKHTPEDYTNRTICKLESEFAGIFQQLCLLPTPIFLFSKSLIIVPSSFYFLFSPLLSSPGAR